MKQSRVLLRSKKNIGRHAAVKTPWKHHGVFPSIKAIMQPGKTQMLHDVGQRFVYPKFAALETTFRKELDAHFDSPKSGKVMKKTFRDAYTKAFQLGKLAASGGMGSILPAIGAEDKTWIEKFIDKEFNLWKKFLEDVKNKRGKMDYDKRREMYVRALNSMYHGARVIACPPMTLFYWKTSLAEHCPHCLYLQSKSPFIKENIPTLPASGDTQCRSNCKCHLQIVQVPVWKYMKIKKTAPTREELLRGMSTFKR